MARESFQFFATTGLGMEDLLRSELEALGARELETTRAGVSFRGGLETAYRACLWSRIANRVLLPVKAFEAHTPEHLYEGVRRVRWSTHLGPESTIAVDFASSKSAISHTHFGALKVKDAIVDQIRDETGSRPSVARIEPDVRINVYLHQNRAQVSIDLSGESLHKRGYREEGAYAPLKENLAAAILLHAEWPKVAKAGGAFLDPMCGSGTLPIEATLIAADRAPGLGRRHFGFLKWRRHQSELWDRLIEEARAREIRDPRKLPAIVGYDRDARAVRAALANIERAELRGRLHVEKRELSAVQPLPSRAESRLGILGGMIVINPPYGERLGETEELKPLYREIGDVFKQRFKGWNGYVFTGNPELAKSIGLRASRRIPLWNGPIECRLLRFELY